MRRVKHERVTLPAALNAGQGRAGSGAAAGAQGARTDGHLGLLDRLREQLVQLLLPLRLPLLLILLGAPPCRSAAQRSASGPQRRRPVI